MLKRGAISFEINKNDHPDDTALFEFIVEKGIEYLNANGYDVKIESVIGNYIAVKSIKIIIRDSLEDEKLKNFKEKKMEKELQPLSELISPALKNYIEELLKSPKSKNSPEMVLAITELLKIL